MRRQHVVDEFLRVVLRLRGFQDHHRPRGNDGAAGREDHLDGFTLGHGTQGHVVHRTEHRRLGALQHRIERGGIGTADGHAVGLERLEEFPGLVPLRGLQAGKQLQRRPGRSRVRHVHLVLEFRLGQIGPVRRARRAALGIPHDGQRGKPLGHVGRPLVHRRHAGGIGALPVQQPAALVQIQRAFPTCRNYDVGARIGRFRFQPRHHLAGIGLEDVDRDAGFLLEPFAECVDQVGRASGIDRQCMRGRAQQCANGQTQTAQAGKVLFHEVILRG